MRPVGVLIDDIVSRKGMGVLRLKNKDKDGYFKRDISKGVKIPYHLRFNKLIACIRILRGRGMVVYYKEDE